ncbi:hypothetical protein [Raineyella fluvialis]|uniref:Uncharacterized protein n=1 Tax=Raineyella fluvialis TaxID=2662261 RepID=A0A5Q2F8T8_9ACTN|nr:hypothetical protein [Raineyella fluvialis]QGF23380.1 hypothetical protein Rai3103_06565 [Raineyella fluvialis]
MSDNARLEPADGNVPLRRPSTRLRQFTPRPEAAEESDSVVLQRNVLRPNNASATEHQTGRRHVVAGDLPDWEPLPPGELFLSRPSGR